MELYSWTYGNTRRKTMSRKVHLFSIKDIELYHKLIFRFATLLRYYGHLSEGSKVFTKKRFMLILKHMNNIYYYYHYCDLVNKKPLTPHEDTLIIHYRYYFNYGWAKIAKVIGNNRTPNQIKNNYNQRLKKRLPELSVPNPPNPLNHFSVDATYYDDPSLLPDPLLISSLPDSPNRFSGVVTTYNVEPSLLLESLLTPSLPDLPNHFLGVDTTLSTELKR